MHSAVGTVREYAENRVLERTGLAFHMSFECPLAIAVYGKWRPRLDLQAETDPKATAWLVLELKTLQITLKCIYEAANRHRLRVLDLIFGEKSVAGAAMPAVRAMTQVHTFVAGAWLDLEISLARRLWTFAAHVAVFVNGDRDAHSIPQASDIVHVK